MADIVLWGGAVFAGGKLLAFLMRAQEHSVAYCRCREAMKLFMFLLSPYSLIGTYRNVQNCLTVGVERL
jgi:hypothetical protein